MKPATVLLSALLLSTLTASLFASQAHADPVVTMNLADATGTGKAIGTISISETRFGLVFTPDLSGLQPGVYGFHVHEKPSCAPASKDGKMVPALAAGPHYDPNYTKQHGTPWGEGHLGDLPVIAVAANGTATNPVLAPRLEMADLKGRSLMIHAAGDNHSDHPAPAGGGGARMACGVIQ
jgi:Cu-Zn family superoxide dismutase